MSVKYCHLCTWICFFLFVSECFLIYIYVIGKLVCANFAIILKLDSLNLLNTLNGDGCYNLSKFVF